MEKQIKNENSKQSHSYLNAIEKNLTSYLLINHCLTLCFNDINFNNYTKVSVFLKNIKTRETLKCISKIENNKLIIDLSSLKLLCTNYEFSIIAILEDNHSSIAIYPKLKSKNSTGKLTLTSDNSNIQWYLRFLENGKLRLSAIYLFSKLDNSTIKKVLI
ncbi:hypothetical protein R0131_11000 [Clostridium sp. AL.422]|uniref:hypothetical protein n=1 Tax=Clostridium TaxID=1485 RepID=UPI00293DAFDA|nr:MULTISPECIES: hypothetical protein [unclassified Clostridium]MDV4151368.1 hypothetical protein [Clostridium sp. AL.422]